MKARRKYRRAFPLRAFLLFLAVSAAVVVSFILWGDEINGWVNDAIASTDGNRFFVALVLFLVLASDIILPVPSSLASLSCGLFLGWKLGFAVSFAAMSVSSAAGYAIGRISSTAAEKLIGASDMASLSCFQQRFGAWTLLALRPVPVLAEASTVMSGVARQPITQVALQLALGNATVSLFYALAGAFFGNGEGTAWWAFLTAMVVTGLFFLAKAVASRLRDGTPSKRRRHCRFESAEDAYVLTHLHPDHFDMAADGTAGAKLDKAVPLFVQNDNEVAIMKRSGFKDVQMFTDDGVAFPVAS